MIKKQIKQKGQQKKNFVWQVILFIALLELVLFFIVFKIRSERENINSQFIAPYYERTVFEKPKEFNQEVNSQATSIKKYKIPIIMYHYVGYIRSSPDFIRKSLNINPVIFESQLKALKDEGYQSYLVREIPELLAGSLYLPEKSVVLTFDDGYEDFYFDVFPLLKKYQMRATIYVIYDFIGKKGFMNEAEIKEILASGLIDLGSHTLDHANLKLSSLSEAKIQIFESKRKLEERFGVEVKTFAYPYGALSPQTVELVKEAGYVAAVSVISGTTQSKDNLFYLSRLRPGLFTPNAIVKFLESYNE